MTTKRPLWDQTLRTMEGKQWDAARAEIRWIMAAIVARQVEQMFSECVGKLEGLRDQALREERAAEEVWLKELDRARIATALHNEMPKEQRLAEDLSPEGRKILVRDVVMSLSSTLGEEAVSEPVVRDLIELSCSVSWRQAADWIEECSNDPDGGIESRYLASHQTESARARMWDLTVDPSHQLLAAIKKQLSEDLAENPEEISR